MTGNYIILRVCGKQRCDSVTVIQNHEGMIGKSVPVIVHVVTQEKKSPILAGPYKFVPKRPARFLITFDAHTQSGERRRGYLTARSRLVRHCLTLSAASVS